jgi:hypothetical protein
MFGWARDYAVEPAAQRGHHHLDLTAIARARDDFRRLNHAMDLDPGQPS